MEGTHKAGVPGNIGHLGLDGPTGRKNSQHLVLAGGQELFVLVLVFCPPPRTCALILETGEGSEREKDRERHVDWLPLTGAPAED